MAENTTDKTLYALLESAAGYALFQVIGFDEIAALISDGSGVTDVQRFGRAVKLHAFKPFTTAAEALENANAISEHAMSETLHNFLELNLATNTSKKSSSKSNKPSSFVVGVIDPALATAIAEGMNGNVPCRSDDTVREILRGCRMHLDVFVKGLSHQQPTAAGAATTTSQQQATALVRAQLGLGHAYSRSKVKFNPARSDNMIIQSIALLDQLDKDINTFAMRVREWYSWHFPELKDLVPDNLMFARAAAVIQNKNTLFQKKSNKDDDDDNEDDDNGDDAAEKKIAELTTVLGGDAELAERVVAAAKTSMGMDCSLVDMMNICNFSTRMVKLAEYRKQLSIYLTDKMSIVAPNLSTLIGDTVAARLISKAGSLTNLAKAPASTVQILGAEKALFRALKTKGNTPKYGLIYHSTFIGRAGAKNKGRISRYLANKCSIATRIDSFSDDANDGTAPSSLYGQKLRDQVEERLQFYETGKPPRRNVDVMQEASREIAAAKKSDNAGDDDNDDVSMSSDVDRKEKKKKSKKDKKRKVEDTEAGDGGGDDVESAKKAAKKAKKEDKKKKKKSKKAE